MNVLQSTSPRSVSLKSGRHASGIMDIVMKGDGSVQPISSHAFSREETCSFISSSGLSLISPAIGRATLLNIVPFCTATSPPLQSIFLC